MKSTIAVFIEEMVVLFISFASIIFFTGAIIMAISQSGSLFLLLKLCLLAALHLSPIAYIAYRLTRYFFDLEHEPFRIWKRK